MVTELNAPSRKRLAAAGALVLLLSACGAEEPWAPLEEVADPFVDSMRAEQYEAARSRLAPDIAANLRAVELSRFRSATGLHEYRQVVWTDGSVEDDRGTLHGELWTAGAESPQDFIAPVRVALERGPEGWRVRGIQRGIRLAEPEQVDLYVPFEAELHALIKDTTLRFGDSVQAGDFSRFRAATAEVFRQRNRPGALAETFSGFVQQGVNLSPVARTTPLLSPTPDITPDGVLRVAGHFPTRPSQVRFAYEFVQESGSWRLAGLALDVGPAE